MKLLLRKLSQPGTWAGIGGLGIWQRLGLSGDGVADVIETVAVVSAFLLAIVFNDEKGAPRATR